MPSCRPDIISGVLYKILDICPKTILDVGAGYGKWGVLCTEYLRYWKDINVRIDGIEIFRGYESPAQLVYRSFWNVDVMDRLDIIPDYDLILSVGSIEHLKREDGLKLLELAKGYVVSTPGYWIAQKECFGNVHETHVSKWDCWDFDNSRMVKDVLGRDHILGWR
jgi:SAM-dependent methyltransferase